MVDIASIAAAIGAVKGAIDIASRLKSKGGELEHQEAVMELREQLLNAKENLLTAREEMNELRENLKVAEGALKTKDDIVRDNNGNYWRKGELIPVCGRCWEDLGKVITMKPKIGSWSCARHPACTNSISRDVRPPDW